MKIILALVLIHIGTYSLSQTVITGDIRGVGCVGGLGLCGGVEVSLQMLKENESTYSEFNLILNEDKISSTSNIDSLKHKKENNVLFSLQNDVLLDYGTIYQYNLSTVKRVLKKGFYPILFQNDKIKVRFTLTEN